jgi:periplasmic protein TonB
MTLKSPSNVVELPRTGGGRQDAASRGSAVGSTKPLAGMSSRIESVTRNSFFYRLDWRMRSALVLSVLVHAGLMFGIAFKMPLKPSVDDKQGLEVVLVNAKSRVVPPAPDALAQHNLDGGGDTEQKRRPRTPLPVVRDQKPDAEVELAMRRVEELEREARELMTQTMPAPPVETAPAQQSAVAQPEAPARPSATEIIQRSFEIARLEGQIARDMDIHQQRPRRKFIGARTQEYRFARYIEDWRQKIQRIGDLNYPQAARDQRLVGSLVVTVAIRADGSVERVEVNRPSGQRVLDDAARHIVELAAPFGAFPPDIAKDTDVLHITRTWTFTPADKFVAEQ